MTQTDPNPRYNTFVLNLPAEVRAGLAAAGIVLADVHDRTDIWNEQARTFEVFRRITEDLGVEAERAGSNPRGLASVRRGYERVGRLLSRLEALAAAEAAVVVRDRSAYQAAVRRSLSQAS